MVRTSCFVLAVTLFAAGVAAQEPAPSDEQLERVFRPQRAYTSPIGYDARGS